MFNSMSYSTNAALTIRLPNFIEAKDNLDNSLLRFKTHIDIPLSISFWISQTNATQVLTLGSLLLY